jgi:hypothetical protein
MKMDSMKRNLLNKKRKTVKDQKAVRSNSKRKNLKCWISLMTRPVSQIMMMMRAGIKIKRISSKLITNPVSYLNAKHC